MTRPAPLAVAQPRYAPSGLAATLGSAGLELRRARVDAPAPSPPEPTCGVELQYAIGAIVTHENVVRLPGRDRGRRMLEPLARPCHTERPVADEAAAERELLHAAVASVEHIDGTGRLAHRHPVRDRELAR